MQVAVIGAGYVGLVQAAGLAELGHHVRVGEADPARLALLQAGRSPIIEPNLEDLIVERSTAGHLSFHASNLDAVAGANVVFVAVPTPPLDDGSADLRILRGVLAEILPALSSGTVVAIKSTVPVGTLDMIAEQFDTASLGVSLASNPEFLREGSALADFRHPDRVVIGARDFHATAVLQKLYEPMTAPILEMDPVSAELVKYGSNAYLALRVTFANALANLCEVVDGDVAAVLGGMGYDPRIGSHFLKPGPGFGGTCLPKDATALVSSAADAGYTFSLLEAVIAENEEQRRRVVAKVRNALGDDLTGRRVALWGMAFKAGTSDTRESPALQVGQLLAEEGAVIRAFDPAVPGPMDGWEIADSALDAASGAEAVVIVTEWSEFGEIDLAALAEALAGDAVIDARNLLDPAEVRSHGLRYWGIGR